MPGDASLIHSTLYLLNLQNDEPNFPQNKIKIFHRNHLWKNEGSPRSKTNFRKSICQYRCV
jgi:hypothetical protein